MANEFPNAWVVATRGQTDGEQFTISDPVAGNEAYITADVDDSVDLTEVR